MKTLFTKTTLLFVILMSSFSFTSCTEDWWYGDGDDLWITDNLIGAWRIVEAHEAHPGDCPYMRDDIMEFFHNGTMRTIGFDLNERGYWQVRKGKIEIDFNGDYRTDLYAYIEQMDEGYMVLDVRDYINGYVARYNLRLVRTYY